MKEFSLSIFTVFLQNFHLLATAEEADAAKALHGLLKTYQIPSQFSCIDNLCSESIGFVKATENYAPETFSHLEDYERWAMDNNPSMYDTLLELNTDDTIDIIADCGQVTSRDLDHEMKILSQTDKENQNSETFQAQMQEKSQIYEMYFGINHRTAKSGCFPKNLVGDIKYDANFQAENLVHSVKFNVAIGENDDPDYLDRMLHNQHGLVETIDRDILGIDIEARRLRQLEQERQQERAEEDSASGQPGPHEEAEQVSEEPETAENPENGPETSSEDLDKISAKAADARQAIIDAKKKQAEQTQQNLNQAEAQQARKGPPLSKPYSPELYAQHKNTRHHFAKLLEDKKFIGPMQKLAKDRAHKMRDKGWVEQQKLYEECVLLADILAREEGIEKLVNYPSTITQSYDAVRFRLADIAVWSQTNFLYEPGSGGGFEMRNQERQL